MRWNPSNNHCRWNNCLSPHIKHHDPCHDPLNHHKSRYDNYSSIRNWRTTLGPVWRRRLARTIHLRFR